MRDDGGQCLCDIHFAILHYPTYENIADIGGKNEIWQVLDAKYNNMAKFQVAKHYVTEKLYCHRNSIMPWKDRNIMESGSIDMEKL